MIHSMTAFCHRSFSLNLEPNLAGTLTLELRSVNHRYLELSLKLCDQLRSLEPLFRSQLNRLTRGKVECRAFWTANNHSIHHTHFNPFSYHSNTLEQLKNTLSALHQSCPESPWPSLDVILNTRGVLVHTTEPSNENSFSAPAAQTIILDTLSQALSVIETMRQEEGQRIHLLLQETIQQCRTLLAPLQENADQLTQLYYQKLRDRLQECHLNLEPDRMFQEATLHALRADIREELDRLRMHLEAAEQALHEGGSVGKHLDFLMQELNREANTLASKAADIHISHAAVALKLCIEQMREHIQNIV
jgi:uncharacterized protein (TIGR00255 family)